LFVLWFGRMYANDCVNVSKKDAQTTVNNNLRQGVFSLELLL